MIKRLGSILVIMAVAAATGWFYFANKFEKIATEEILPKLQKDESLISIDKDSIVIDKYKFKLTLQDIRIFAKSEFKIHADEITACYNPLSDSIKAQITGNKLTIGEGEMEFYFPSPSHRIDFNRSLINSNFDNFKISVSSKDSSVYFANDDKFISKSDNSKIVISNSLDDDMYEMNLKVKIDALQMNPESQFLIKVLNQISSEFAKNGINSKIDGYYYKMLGESGPINYKTKYSVQLGKDHVHSLIASLKGEKDIKDVLENFAFTKDVYSIDISESIKNSTINDFGDISFSSDGEKIKAEIDVALNRNYNEEQRKNITEIFKDLLFEGFKLLNDEDASRIENKLTEGDFIKLSEMLADVNKIETIIDVEYDIKSKNLEQEFKFVLNDFKIKSEGEVKDKVYNGTIEIYSPKLITDGIPYIYESGARPILVKLSDNNDDAVNIAAYDKISKNIQENGFSALSTFHKDEELKENSELVTELTFDPNGFKFKINDKGFFEILTDERIANFLENMPTEDEVEVK